MRSEDTRMADGGMELVPGCDVAVTAGILDGYRVPGGTRDDLNWSADKVCRLATERPAKFDYLRLTRFAKERAAELTRQGPFEGEPEAVLEGVAKYGLQVGGIYLRVLRSGAEERLRQVERLTRGRAVAVLDAWLRIDMAAVERDFLTLLEVICLEPDLTKTVYGFPAICWVNGKLGTGGRLTTELLPPAVAVAVRVRPHGLCILVMPSAAEQAERLLAGVRGGWYCERYVRGNDVSAELEQLCAGPKTEGLRSIRLGAGRIQFLRATANDAGDTLHVVCLDRTMVIRQAGRSRPPSTPRDMTAVDESGDRYYVAFDNGVVDVFTVRCRAHKENEAPWMTRGESGKCEVESEKQERANHEGREEAEGMRGPQIAQSDADAGSGTGHPKLGTGGTTEGTDGADGSHAGTKARIREGGVARNGAKSAAAGSGTGRGQGASAHAVGNPPLAPPKTGTAGLGTPAHQPASGLAKVEILGDFKVIRMPDGHEITLATKHKARAVLRHIWEQLTEAGTDTFYAYMMRESFNEQFQGDMEGKRWESDRIREDLFRGSEADFDRVIETLDRASDHYRLKILGAVRR